jgi:hypothetical protein
MGIAMKLYDTRGSNMMNKCRIYLKIISLFNLLLFDTDTIHPSYLQGKTLPSRISQHI